MRVIINESGPRSVIEGGGGEGGHRSEDMIIKGGIKIYKRGKEQRRERLSVDGRSNRSRGAHCGAYISETCRRYNNSNFILINKIYIYLYAPSSSGMNLDNLPRIPGHSTDLGRDRSTAHDRLGYSSAYLLQQHSCILYLWEKSPLNIMRNK